METLNLNKGRTTAELTQEYIKNHPSIKSCLQNGLINYSALARLISRELNIQKKTSLEAILIAARRFQDKLQKEIIPEKKVKELLQQSEMEVKNKILVCILNKNIDFNQIDKLQGEIRKEQGLFYLIEGSDSYTLLIQEKFSPKLKIHFKNNIIKVGFNMAMIIFKSPKEVETRLGWVAYLTSLFSENGVNIVEFLSCWTDTIFVIEAKDVTKAFTFLNV